MVCQWCKKPWTETNPLHVFGKVHWHMSCHREAGKKYRAKVYRELRKQEDKAKLEAVNKEVSTLDWK